MKNKKNNTLISIVMPVYNTERFLHASLNSILKQTYENWELICVDDASTDNSLKILKSYAKKDKRIHVFGQNTNQGVSRTANFALRKAKGTLVARMDADDIMLPRRIEKQVRFLNNNPKVVAVGGQCLLINEKGKKIGSKSFPLNHEAIYKMIYQAMPIQQPTLMISKKLLPKGFIWYEKEFTTAEEVDLLFRLFNFGKIANLPDFTLKYRLHGNNISLKNPKETFLLTYQTRKEAINKHGYRPTFSAKVISCAQWMTIRIIPSAAIFPLFTIWRGVKPFRPNLFNQLKIKLPREDFSMTHQAGQLIGHALLAIFFVIFKKLNRICL